MDFVDYRQLMRNAQGFDPELGLLSVWRFTSSYHVSIDFRPGLCAFVVSLQLEMNK